MSYLHENWVKEWTTDLIQVFETALKDGEGQKNYYGGELTKLSDKEYNEVPNATLFWSKIIMKITLPFS